MRIIVPVLSFQGGKEAMRAPKGYAFLGYRHFGAEYALVPFNYFIKGWRWLYRVFKTKAKTYRRRSY